MLPLRELQLRFATHLLGPGAPAADLCIRPYGLDPDARLEIYRNNVRESFIKTLALEFPVMERLVGTDYIRILAEEFRGCFPSRSGDLHHIGAPFESFLRKKFKATSYAYLADVAALEWALQECLVAEEVTPLDVGELRAVAVGSYGSLRFTLRPSSRLVYSPYPVLRIWEINQPDSSAAEQVDLDSGADHVLACRGPNGVRFHRMLPTDYRMLNAFAKGASLDEALEVTLTLDPAFDLGFALRRCIALQALAPLTYTEAQ